MQDLIKETLASILAGLGTHSHQAKKQMTHNYPSYTQNPKVSSATQLKEPSFLDLRV